MYKNLTLSLLITFLFCYSSSFAQTTYFVDIVNGSNANGGLKKTEAFQTITNAINIAEDGDIIRIAAGLYGEQLNIDKRIVFIGAGNGDDPANSTLLQRATGQVVTIDAGTVDDLFVELNNLNVEANSNGSAVTINSSNVKLERVKLRGAQQRAIQINSSVSNIIINRAEVHGSNIGLLVNDDINVDGLSIQNSLFRNHRNHAIMFRESNPTIAGKVENVHISKCLFRDNNPTNINLGHVIYAEKLSNATFENISIYTPLSNSQNAIDINVKWRSDYENILIRNVLISRETEGVGIFVKGRDDAPLYDAAPASLSNVNISGCRFSGCRSNIRFENNVTGIFVNRNDLSGFNAQQGFGLVNLSTALSPMNADHNYFSGNPFVGLGYAASSTEGSNVITILPPFDASEVTPGLFVFGQNVPFGTIITELNGLELTLSNPVSASVAQDAFMFSPNIFPSAHVLSAAINPRSIENPLGFRTVNNLNQSFENLEAALLGTPADGEILHVNPTTYPGGINVDRTVKIQTAGAGVLDPNAVPQFDNLIINNANLLLNMDIAVVNQLILNGNLYLNDQQLNLEGKVSGTGHFFSTGAGSISVSGTDSVGTLRFDSEAAHLSQFIYNRANNGALSILSEVYVDYAALQSGVMNVNDHTFYINNPEIQILQTDFNVYGRLALQAASENSTFDLFFPTSGSLEGRRNINVSLRQANAQANYYTASMIEESSYDLALDLPDGIDRVSPIRYWLLESGEDNEIAEALVTIYYQQGDLIKDADPEKLKMLKQADNGEAMWMNIGGFANPPVNGFITSSVAVTELGFFTLGNVVGGNNLIPDTIYVDALNGNDTFTGLSPVFVTGTNDGPKQTINNGIITVAPTGVVSIEGAYYQERVLLNKKITLTKTGALAVSADTLVIMNGVELQANLPIETDFAINTVDLEPGAKLADGFLLVAEDGVVYLRDGVYPENVSTNKSFIIKGLGEVTVSTINLNADNVLTLGTPFVVGNQINLNDALGSKVRIYDDNLTVNNLNQITGVSGNSYVITEGDGLLTLNNFTDEPLTFPVGTAAHYAPVDMRDDNNTGDAIGVSVRLAEVESSFSPELPLEVTSFVQLQWTINEANPAGHSAKLGFNYNNLVQVNGFDSQPERVVARSEDGIAWNDFANSTGTPGNMTVLGLTSLGGEYALYTKFTVNVNEVQTQSTKVFPTPFQNNLNLVFENGFEGTIQLVDITGRAVYNCFHSIKTRNVQHIDLPSQLSKGVYILNLISDLNVESIRIIKN